VGGTNPPPSNHDAKGFVVKGSGGVWGHLPSTVNHVVLEDWVGSHLLMP
jgi:hypothetical protein